VRLYYLQTIWPIGIDSKEDLTRKLGEIGAKEGRLHGELTRLETEKSLASAFMKRINRAEATIKDLAAKTNLESNEDRRRAIEALLHRVDVRTIGEGRKKRPELTFHWLGQGTYTRLDVKDLANEGASNALLNHPDILADAIPDY
jgi:hypothetical protein